MSRAVALALALRVARTASAQSYDPRPIAPVNSGAPGVIGADVIPLPFDVPQPLAQETARHRDLATLRTTFE